MSDPPPFGCPNFGTGSRIAAFFFFFFFEIAFGRPTQILGRAPDRALPFFRRAFGCPNFGRRIARITIPADFRKFTNNLVSKRTVFLPGDYQKRNFKIRSRRFSVSSRTTRFYTLVFPTFKRSFFLLHFCGNQDSASYGASRGYAAPDGLAPPGMNSAAGATGAGAYGKQYDYKEWPAS